MKTLSRFIAVDDDLIDNMLCLYTIKKTGHEFDIQTFNFPEKCFEYIVSEYSKNDDEILTVLLLDINMPTWTGWDFLENFNKLDNKIKQQIKIYILSSSIDEKDIQRAKDNENVIDYIVKPITLDIVSKIILNYSN